MHIAVVSQHRWAVKVHAAQMEMVPPTFRSLCGKPWMVANGKKFEDVVGYERCERCDEYVRRLTPETPENPAA